MCINFVDYKFLNEKILWILVICKNHKIKSTTDFFTYTVSRVYNNRRGGECLTAIGTPNTLY